MFQAAAAANHTSAMEMETKREKMKQFKITIYVESYEDYTQNNSIQSNSSINSSLREFEQNELNAAASTFDDSNLLPVVPPSPSNHLTRNVIEGVNIQPVKQPANNSNNATPSTGRSQLKSSDDEFFFQAPTMNYENMYPVLNDSLNNSKPPLGEAGGPHTSGLSNSNNR